MDGLMTVFVITAIILSVAYATRQGDSANENSKNNTVQATVYSKESDLNHVSPNNFIGFCLAFTYCALVLTICINNVTIKHEGDITLKAGGMLGHEINLYHIKGS